MTKRSSTTGEDVAGITLEELIESVDLKIDEYSKSIYGFKETAHMDTLYEEYVSFLSSLKEQLINIKEMIE